MRRWPGRQRSPRTGLRRYFIGEHIQHKLIRRHSQEVRQRSAKPLFPGSNPGDASKTKRHFLRSAFCFGMKRTLGAWSRAAPYEARLRCMKSQALRHLTDNSGRLILDNAVVASCERSERFEKIIPPGRVKLIDELLWKKVLNVTKKEKSTSINCWRSKLICFSTEYAITYSSGIDMVAYFCPFVNPSGKKFCPPG